MIDILLLDPSYDNDHRHELNIVKSTIAQTIAQLIAAQDTGDLVAVTFLQYHVFVNIARGFVDAWHTLPQKGHRHPKQYATGARISSRILKCAADLIESVPDPTFSQ